MGTPKHILIVDDEENHRLMLKLHLEDHGYEITEAENGAEALILTEEERPDCILLDLKMDIMDGMTFLNRYSARGGSTPVIVITAFSTVKTAVEAMKLGAVDYLTKPVDIENLLETLDGLSGDEKTTLNTVTDYYFEGIYSNEGLGDVIDKLKMVAPLDATVLIMGESGTGKELIAKSIHTNSPRAKKSFVAVNCAALSENLIESELFGHVKGAFTGAAADKQGKFEVADGGTIFLDEIGEMNMEAQAKLLRVLQEKSFDRVGGTKLISVDARVVAATNKDLKKMCEEGRFREDLYFRLMVFPVEVPPLRKRKSEIPMLIDYFIKKYSAQFNKLIKGAKSSYIEKLMEYHFPGNIRELQNIVERSIILTRGEKLEAETLPNMDKPKNNADNHEATLDVKENERELIIKALEQTGGNKTKAAQVLGISRRTLHTKIKDYDIC